MDTLIVVIGMSIAFTLGSWVGSGMRPIFGHREKSQGKVATVSTLTEQELKDEQIKLDIERDQLRKESERLRQLAIAMDWNGEMSEDKE